MENGLKLMLNKGDRIRCLSKRNYILFNKIGVIVDRDLRHCNYDLVVEFVNPFYPNSIYKVRHNYKGSELKLINKEK